MSTISYAVQQTFRSLGIHISKLPEHHTLSRHLADLLESLAINCVIDVGAHYGEYARRLREEVGYRGWIISFEPSRASYEILCKHMAEDAKWQGHQIALADEAGNMQLNVFAASDLNSFCAPNEAVVANTLTAHFSPAGKETVEVKRLDSLAATVQGVLGERQPLKAFLKMDTQGFDTKVFAGAEGLLQQVLAIQSELPCRQLYKGVQSMGDILNVYAQKEYTPTFFFPTVSDKGGLVPIEFDCVLKRNQL